MTLEPAICYRALKARDARFDGRFFVAVRSTGVYCRPVCPAPTPKLENCTFVACAAAAQEAGYRPCLRCRPETSPGTPAWQGSSATVSRALRLIGEGALRDAGVEDLAMRLGIGERQLRRLFDKHLGASPIAVEQNRRILFAKKLIDETALPMTELAFASGFASVRRFNDAIRGTYQRTPSDLRRVADKRRTRGRPSESTSASDITLRLPYRKPFDWDAVIGFLGPRAIPGVESVTSTRYVRSVRLGEAHGVVEVSHARHEDALHARIGLSSSAALIETSSRLRRIFDLDADPQQIRAHLRVDPALQPVLKRHAGVRVPGAWDGFELAVRAVLGQQVTVKGATTLAGRLVERFGTPLGDEEATHGVTHLFPEPAELRDADLTTIGLPQARAQAIASLAAAVDDGALRLDASPGLDESIEALCALRGVGDWTAQYIAMRALREPDAFPAGDLALRKALGNGAGPVTARALRSAAEAWRPWRAYAAMSLWLDASHESRRTKT